MDSSIVDRNRRIGTTSGLLGFMQKVEEETHVFISETGLNISKGTEHTSKKEITYNILSFIQGNL